MCCTDVKKVMNLIEENISVSINVQRIAKECFVSPRQLYRDFYSITGHSVKEYVRRRRLSKALCLLKYSDMSAADIAYVCGYCSQAALCRAVKAALGVTVTEYINGEYHYFFPICAEYPRMPVEVATETIPETISVFYYFYKETGIEKRALTFLSMILPEYSGRVFGKNVRKHGGKFCYELMVQYSEDTVLALSDYKNIQFAVNPPIKRTFAKIIVEKDESTINGAWNYLYGHWLKNSMFEPDAAPYFEEYRFGVEGDATISFAMYYRLQLYLPVRPRENYPKIRIQSFEDRFYLVSKQEGVDAEKLASETVASAVLEYCPELLREQREYYVSKTDDSCACGISIGDAIKAPKDTRIELLTVAGGEYAVLEGLCYGGGVEYEQMLLYWIAENGFEPDGGLFTIYDASRGTEWNELIAKAQVKMAEKDNTSFNDMVKI